MSALLLVGGRATPVLLKEQLKAFGRRAEVFLGVHGAQNLVRCNTLIELCRQLDESLAATDQLIEVATHCLALATDANANRFDLAGFFESV